MRILWHSVAPWAPSGYGQQTALFAPRLRDQGHEVAVSAYYGLAGGMLTWDGVDVYPSDNVYGRRLLPTYAAVFGADLTVTLMDLWVLKAKAVGMIDNLACWVPEDHSPAKPSTVRFLEETKARPIAMSRFGERALRGAGLDPLYVPHGIDTTVFRPLREKREWARARLGIDPHAFVVGMVAANVGRTPSRKAFPEVMQAFAEFHRERPDAHLHIHTDPSELQQGVPLIGAYERCGVPEEAISFSDQLQVELGLPAEQMAQLYAAFDVLANPSYGEGFGIPIIEAQACGVPVIVTDFSAMTELCGAGWLVQPDPWYDAQHGSFFGRPRVTGQQSILGALHEAYERRGDRDLRRKARRFAEDYDVDRIADRYWRPTLAKLTPPEASQLVTPASEIIVPGAAR